MAVLGDRPAIGVEGKLLGLEHRDTILVLRPGPVAGFVFLFRVPLAEPTVAAQMLATGTGGLNLGQSRVASQDDVVVRSGEQSPWTEAHEGYQRPGRSMFTTKPRERSGPADVAGRWPPNILLVHGACRGACELGCPVPILDALSGERPVSGRATSGDLHTASSPGYGGWGEIPRSLPNDSGGASRFYPQFESEAGLLAWLSRLVGGGLIFRDGI